MLHYGDGAQDAIYDDLDAAGMSSSNPTEIAVGDPMPRTGRWRHNILFAPF